VLEQRHALPDHGEHDDDRGAYYSRELHGPQHIGHGPDDRQGHDGHRNSEQRDQAQHRLANAIPRRIVLDLGLPHRRAVTDCERECRKPETEPGARSRRADVDLPVPDHPHDAVAEHRGEQQDPATIRAQAHGRCQHHGQADRREQADRIGDQDTEVQQGHRSLTWQVQVECEREQHEREREDIQQKGA